MRVFANDAVSLEREVGAWKWENGSHTSSENGSNTLFRRVPKMEIGISDIVDDYVINDFQDLILQLLWRRFLLMWASQNNFSGTTKWRIKGSFLRFKQHVIINKVS
ncbi:hypothetical protein RJ641_005626 [Dillenia turbinata]|uniref:Uncharacterized protein n=1 Tax=Dillenia turbinata TaxID=194707 RepID=A0AAN8VGC5_9MAGN